MALYKNSNIDKNGVYVNREEGQVERKRNEAAGAGVGQRWQDHHNQKVQRRRYQRDLSHPRLQY